VAGIVDHPLVAGAGAEATLEVDGDATAFWREIHRALLPKLGWSATVSEPMVSLARGTLTWGTLTWATQQASRFRPMMHVSCVWASQTSCTISQPPTRALTGRSTSGHRVTAGLHQTALSCRS